MEFKSSMNFKGEGSIMILGLLKDDDSDTEMKRMTDLLRVVAEKSGRKCTRQDCSVSLNECIFTGATTLYITGHSRTMETNTKIRPVPNRKLGGFELDAVGKKLFQGVCAGITDIEFWCCESAWKPGNANYKGNATGTMAKRFGNMQLQIVCEHLDAGNWGQISTLEFICFKLTELALETSTQTGRPLNSFPTVNITALNGVGYITKEDTYITTFDQGAMLAEYNKILGFEKQIREKQGNLQLAAKNLRNADQRLRAHIAMRSCHFITYKLDFGALSAELDFTKEQKLPSRISGSRMNRLNAKIEPVLKKHLASLEQQ